MRRKERSAGERKVSTRSCPCLFANVAQKEPPPSEWRDGEGPEVRVGTTRRGRMVPGGGERFPRCIMQAQP